MKKTKITNAINQAHKSNKELLTVGATGLLLLISSPTVLAQDANKAVEVIEVTGVRSSLESALLTKRDAPSIVDAISATDIDSLPALDLGEALQAIPGIQLERSAEGRQSEISLRGLSGGFVKTTAFGQGFATPSNSESVIGASNPFSAFESGVFDGLTVVKTPTADMQAGGIAGVVDQKLQQALSKQDGKFAISIGGRYEELTQNVDPTLKLSGVKHIIKDELAVAFKFSGSGQTFRRDTANFTTYAPMGENPLTGISNSDTIDAYRAQWNIPAEADVRGVALARNVTEFSDGDRISFTGNIEWKPIDDLKLGTHILYTERNLDKGTKQDAMFGSGYNEVNPRNSDRFYKIEPDMASEPFLYDYTESGAPVYGVTKTSISDGQYQFTNRETTFLETSEGIMLYADYTLDNWVLDGVITHSKSENQFMNIGLDTRLTGHQNATTTLNGVRNVPTVPTGVNVDIDAAFGNSNQASVSATGYENITWDVVWPSATNLNASSVTTADAANDGKRLGFFVTGRVKNPVREVSSIELNSQRFLDINFDDVLRFDSVKFGFRHSIEDLDNRDQQLTIGGINTAAITDAQINTTDLVTNGQASFFNGHYPGTFDANSGWRTFNNDSLQFALTGGGANLAELENGVIVEPSGFYERITNGRPFRFANNFTAESEITAIYAMTDFSGEVGLIPYSGNVGVRHIQTDNTFDGATLLDGELIDLTVKSDYSHTLPSVNINVELHEDVVLRAAYNKGIVRPNLLSQTPSTTLSSTNTKATITKPKASVEPYESDNYDISLEWYNREGSAISVGLFRKQLSGFFVEQETCPTGDPLVTEFLGSDITRVDNPDSGGFICTQNEPYTRDDGDIELNREVEVNETINGEGTIELNGVELAIQQKLDFLPYPWNGFGGVFNYTYIDQKTSAEVSDDNENAKLYQVSPKSYNIIGYYENDGFSFRLSYNWKDDSVLKGTNSYLGTLPRIQQANGRLDFSSSYAINKNLKVFLRGYNLTDEQRVESWGFDERAVSRVDYTGKIWEASLNYTF